MTSDRDKEIQDNIRQEILLGRQLSLADIIGREGGDFLKGESPVPPLVQAITEINFFISKNLSDSSGALQAVLQNWVKADEAGISQHLNHPLLALRQLLESILNNSELLYELVKQVDSKWGQMYDERPYFQLPGQPPHPEDEYTHQSVRDKLTALLQLIQD
ncbi:conserved hypothetical protein [Gloeothece citriformis PCC 7424]|uniref:Uncharacterized protein n=1 Tax=Gloeothece citriformis (strain PCC 7424) TaxID=65393 RepID=B7KH97_GLOC7|nr:hypothetical protein [Gloeothece citriformis]ACK69306.1 conserved hypothetical protein [Gloeothece citriformis PCC 7424]